MLTAILLCLSWCCTFLAGAWTYRHFGFDIERAFNIAKYRIRKRLDDL